MKHFFLVADWGAKHYLTVPNILLSAGMVYHPKKKGWDMSRTNLPHGFPDKLMLDSGGYSLLNTWGKYPFTLDEYTELAHTLIDSYPLYKIATLDIPCDTQKDNKNRIEETVKNAVDCIGFDDSLPWMPVIQGHTIQEYHYCIELYREYGIFADLWGVGSIVSRKKNPLELRNIITTIKKEMGDAKLHAFGLGIPQIKDPQIFNAIHSSDSAAWNWWISGDDSRRRKEESAIAYWAQMQDMIEAMDNQTFLEEFS